MDEDRCGAATVLAPSENRCDDYNTALLHSTCNTKHPTIAVAKYLLLFVSCFTRHQQPNEGVRTRLAGREHQCVWIF